MTMETKTIHLFAYTFSRDMDWVKQQVQELASHAEVIVKSVDETPRKENSTRTAIFSSRQIPYTRTTAYDYYATVIGEPINIERFEYAAKGFLVGFNSRSYR